MIFSRKHVYISLCLMYGTNRWKANSRINNPILLMWRVDVFCRFYRFWFSTSSAWMNFDIRFRLNVRFSGIPYQMNAAASLRSCVWTTDCDSVFTAYFDVLYYKSQFIVFILLAIILVSRGKDNVTCYRSVNFDILWVWNFSLLLQIIIPIPNVCLHFQKEILGMSNVNVNVGVLWSACCELIWILDSEIN